MRKLEHQVAALRAAKRRALARRAGTDPGRVRPERLVLRLDEGDLVGLVGDGPRLSPARWHALLVSAVEWLGPVPVTIIALRSAARPQTAELVRFAHRLECGTELVTDGSGIDLAKAKELVDRGLARVRVLVGGISPEVHQHVVGGTLDDAVGAVNALVAARTDRQVALDIEVATPWQEPADGELRAVIGWARQAGADGFRLLAPWRARELPRDPETLDQVEQLAAGFDRTLPGTLLELQAMAAHQDAGPGLDLAHAPARRRRMRCPVGGQRLELTATGRLYSCPFKPPIVAQADADDTRDLRELFAGAGPHLAAIAECGRACVHHELAPRPILSRP